MKKDEQLKERNQLEEAIKSLEEKLKEFDEMKFQNETMTMHMETLKRTIKGINLLNDLFESFCRSFFCLFPFLRRFSQS